MSQPQSNTAGSACTILRALPVACCFLFLAGLVALFGSPATLTFLLRTNDNTTRCRNVVLTTGTGGSYEGDAGKSWAARFGGSLRRANSTADIVYFVDNVDASMEVITGPLRMSAVRMAGYTDSPSVWGSLGYATRRFHYYRKFLEAHAKDYACGSVLVIDALDSFFQRDPFSIDFRGACVFVGVAAVQLQACIPRLSFTGASVLVFLEWVRIVNEPWNSGWLDKCYGPEMLHALQHNNASCSGSTIGTYAGMLQYMRLMENATLIENQACREYFGHDQGHHNYLVWSGALNEHLAAAGLGNLSMMSNVDGPGLSIAFPGSYHMDGENHVVNFRGHIAHFVHQFNRHPELVELVGTMFPVSAVLHSGVRSAVLCVLQLSASLWGAVSPEYY